MSFTPYNAPILAGLLGDLEVAGAFSVAADVAAMTRFESALALAEGANGVIPDGAGQAIASACETFAPDVRAIGLAVARDGVAVPEYVRQLRVHVGSDHAAHVHFGATSQDVIDTSMVLRLRDVARILEARLTEVGRALDDLGTRSQDRALMGRTRMQAAIGIGAHERVRIWRDPLAVQLGRLDEVRSRLLKVQFGGAVGTRDRLAGRADAVTRDLAARLGLHAPAACWHTDRSAIAEFCGWLSLVSGALGKMGQDIALMAQQGVDEITLSGGGGSSAMPHKQNPVAAEVLVTLARFNAVQLSGLHHALVHEQERSGAAWMLEWMIVPQMCVATGAATRTAVGLIASVGEVGTARR